ncbi:MAG: NgoPII family restriction endonuclease, partial [Patescibacteria group bacterium]
MNILEGFLELGKLTAFDVGDGDVGNTIQRIGGGLETFVKDIFSGTYGQELDHEQRLRRYNEAFSLIGNSRNPPDLILKNDDAIEIKKVDGLKSDIQLNSSPPKAYLLADDTRINRACRELASKEGWSQKDFFYAVGSLVEGKIIRLWFVHGECYAADHSIYETASSRVAESIGNDYSEGELGETNEIASVPNIDPLGITRLRIRGMWIIRNPSIVFGDYL